MKSLKFNVKEREMINSRNKTQTTVSCSPDSSYNSRVNGYSGVEVKTGFAFKEGGSSLASSRVTSGELHKPC